MKRIVVALLVLAGVAGCARVKPWRRETLARPEMQAPPWPMLRRGSEHVYEIREASQGATGQAGGGCGCN